jgi:hypothetical protein
MLTRIQNNRLALAFLTIAAWTAFGVFFGTQNYIRDAYRGDGASLPGYLASWLICGYSWAILTGPVTRMVRVAALTRLGWTRFFAAHIPLAAMFALVQLGVYVIIASTLFGTRGRGMWEFYKLIAANEFQSSFLVYFVIVSAVTAHDKWSISTELAASEAPPVNGNGGFVRRFAVKENGRIVLVDADSVNWVESYGNYVFLHTEAKRHILRETMAAMEKKLDPEQFVRLRRSAIVRAEQIEELRLGVNGEYEVKLRCGRVIASTRRYRKNLEDYIRT